MHSASGAPRGGTMARALLACCVVLAPPAIYGQQSERAKNLGHNLKCICGCNQILIECNHVGCTYSHAMLKELGDRIARGDSDDLTLQSFIQEYGPEVALLPEAKGFYRWIWIMPVLAPLAGLVLVRAMVLRWRKRAALAPAGYVPPELLERARRESGDWGGH
jgi:cytochrome c-type biogenesis protein CcmH